MEINQYTNLTKKKPLKTKPRTRPLPKATQKYLEAEETLFQELEESLIGYRRVNFLFDTADKLIQANIKGDDLKNEGLVQLRFDSLHKLLTQKYGQPEFKSDDKVSWKTSSTTIELSKFILKSINVAMINISYKPNSKVEGETSNL